MVTITSTIGIHNIEPEKFLELFKIGIIIDPVIRKSEDQDFYLAGCINNDYVFKNIYFKPDFLSELKPNIELPEAIAFSNHFKEGEYSL